MTRLTLAAATLLTLLFSPFVLAESGVVRAVITTEVVDREPVNDLQNLQISDERAYFFTELRGMSEQSITHRWIYDGAVTAEIDFHIGGPRWRVWSSKGIAVQQRGQWLVEVVDGMGNVIHQKTFDYAP